MGMKKIKWYVVFRRISPTKHPTMRLLKKLLNRNIQHVFALRTVSPHTVAIDYTGFNINTKLYENQTAEEVLSRYFDRPKYLIVEYETTEKDCQLGVHIGNIIPGCVSIVKMALGITNYAFTPYSLYRWLVLNGGNICLANKQHGGKLWVAADQNTTTQYSVSS